MEGENPLSRIRFKFKIPKELPKTMQVMEVGKVLKYLYKLKKETPIIKKPLLILRNSFYLITKINLKIVLRLFLIALLTKQPSYSSQLF